MNDRVKVCRYLLGLSSQTKNFAVEVNDIICLESTYSDGMVA